MWALIHGTSECQLLLVMGMAVIKSDNHHHRHDETQLPGLPLCCPGALPGDLGSSHLPFSSLSSWGSGFILFLPLTTPIVSYTQQMFSTWPSVRGHLFLAAYPVPEEQEHGTCPSGAFSRPASHSAPQAWPRTEGTFCGIPPVRATLTLLSFLVAFLQVPAPGLTWLRGLRVAMQCPQMSKLPWQRGSVERAAQSAQLSLGPQPWASTQGCAPLSPLTPSGSDPPDLRMPDPFLRA